jgi:hypothetical protein
LEAGKGVLLDHQEASCDCRHNLHLVDGAQDANLKIGYGIDDSTQWGLVIPDPTYFSHLLLPFFDQPVKRLALPPRHYSIIARWHVSHGHVEEVIDVQVLEHL